MNRDAKIGAVLKNTCCAQFGLANAQCEWAVWAPLILDFSWVHAVSCIFEVKDFNK